MAVELVEGVLIANRYRLERVVGEGGMGTVWAARHEVTGRRHALKFLRGEAVASLDMRRRFLREARAACSVDHPNVVTVSDVFDIEDGTPVMVMDLLEGETLGDRLRRERKLSLRAAADVLLPVVSAVAAAHAQGIVHRDLKPDNIFLIGGPAANSVRVLDFGVAKLVDSPEDKDAVTRTGTVIGTPCYMSPEQGFGEKDIDYRSDLWSLGAILYEMLSGVRPVEGDTVGQVVKRLLEDGITPIDAMVDLPSDITTLIDGLLRRERTERLSDLRTVSNVLEKYATAVPSPVLDGPLVAAPAERADAARRSSPLLILVIVCVSVAGFSVVRTFTSRPERPDVASTNAPTQKLQVLSMSNTTVAPHPAPPAAPPSAPPAASFTTPEAQEAEHVASAAGSARTKAREGRQPIPGARRTEEVPADERPAAAQPPQTAPTVDKPHGLVEHPPF